MKSVPIAFFLAILVVSCTKPPDTAVTSPPGDSVPTNPSLENPFAPQPEDDNLTRGEAFIHETSLVIRESFPPQISVMLRGDLPTPCNALRIILNPPDEENKIVVEVYSVADPDRICTQVLQPFEESLDLGTYPSGHYTVWVNDALAGEFDT